MSEQDVAQNWANVWMDAQRKYMDTWLNMSRQGVEQVNQAFAPPPVAPNHVFAQGMDWWWKTLTAGLPAQEKNVAERLFEMNKGYLKLGEQFWQMAQGAQHAAQAGQNWQDALQQQIKHWQETLLKPGAFPLATGATSWGMPMDQQWQKMMQAMMPNEISPFLPPGAHGPDKMRQWLEQWSSLPAVGYTREAQEDFQKWTQLWLKYQEASKHFENIMTQVNQRSFDLLSAKLTQMSREGVSLESMRHAYELWVEYSEVAYGEVANSTEFAQAQAMLTNTMMAIKQHAQTMIEESLQAWNQPTRKELDTAHQRIHALRKEVRQLRHQLSEAGIGQLHDKIDKLRADMRTLENTASKAASPASSNRAKKTTEN